MQLQHQVQYNTDVHDTSSTAIRYPIISKDVVHVVGGAVVDETVTVQVDTRRIWAAATSHSVAQLGWYR